MRVLVHAHTNAKQFHMRWICYFVEKECENDWLFGLWGESGHLQTRGPNWILKIVGKIYIEGT